MRRQPMVAFLGACSAVLLAGGVTCGPPGAETSQPRHGFLHHPIDPAYPHGHISTQDAGDIDGDGWLDIAVRSGKSGPSEIAWYRNPLGGVDARKGGWEKFIVGNDGYPKGSRSSGTGLLLHDVDRDGRLDLITGATVKEVGNGLFWWQCPPDPTTERWLRHTIRRPDPETGEEFAPHDLMVADIDGDDVEDLVIGGSSNQGVYWVRIPAEPTREDAWKLHRVGEPRGYAYAGLAVGDLDRDGRTDIVRSDQWYRSVGPRGEPRWEPHLYGLVNTPPSNIELADLDGDGGLDIVVSSGHNPSKGEVVWYHAGRDPTRPWKAYTIDRSLAGPENLVVWQSLDGTQRVLTAELDFQNQRIGERRTLVYTPLGKPTGRWDAGTILEGPNFHMMRQADLDNDGDMDLYAASFEEPDGRAHVDWFEYVGRPATANSTDSGAPSGP